MRTSRSAQEDDALFRLLSFRSLAVLSFCV